MIVVINTLTIIVRWNYLPDSLPAHFDLWGNANDTMPYSASLRACNLAYFCG